MTAEVSGSILDTLDSLIKLANEMDTGSTEMQEKSEYEPEDDDDDMLESVLHICDKCSFQSDDIEDFIDHVLNDPHVFTCLKCSEKLSIPLRLKKHYGSVHGSTQTIPCDDCRYKAESKELLHKHKFVNHISNVYTCITCNQYYSDSNKFGEHLNTHPEPKNIQTGQKILKKMILPPGQNKQLLKCDQCDYKGNGWNLQEHVQSIHENNTYYCDQCAFTTRFRWKLTAHICKHHDKKFLCDQCSFSGFAHSNLKKHKERVHLNKSRIPSTDKESISIGMFPCDICCVVLKSSSILSCHKKIQHYTVPNLQCELCDYKTKTKSTLKAHIDEVHKKIRHTCDECDYSSARKYGIKVHKDMAHKLKLV